MTNYYWLLMKDGSLSIGVKPENRSSWAIMDQNGFYYAIDDTQILDTQLIKKPHYMLTRDVIHGGKIL